MVFSPLIFLTTSGHAALEGGNLVVSNLSNGLDHYHFPSLQRIKGITFTIQKNKILEVAIIPEHGWFLSGGDDGYARIYDSRTGQLLRKLQHEDGESFSSFRLIDSQQLHGPGDLVQIVTVRRDPFIIILLDNYCWNQAKSDKNLYLFATASCNGKRHEIRVWKYKFVDAEVNL